MFKVGSTNSKTRNLEGSTNEASGYKLQPKITPRDNADVVLLVVVESICNRDIYGGTMKCNCGFEVDPGVSFCSNCGLSLSVTSINSEVLTKHELPKASKESLREVKEEAKRRQRDLKSRRRSSRRIKFRSATSGVRIGLGVLTSLLSGVSLILSGVIPWGIVTFGEFQTAVTASTISEWLPVYTIVCGLVVVGATLTRSDELRGTVGGFSLVTIGISAYIWSQVNQLLNLSDAFGYLTNVSASASVQDYLQPEIGLFLWLGSAVLGMVSYLFND